MALTEALRLVLMDLMLFQGHIFFNRMMYNGMIASVVMEAVGLDCLFLGGDIVNNKDFLDCILL